MPPKAKPKAQPKLTYPARTVPTPAKQAKNMFYVQKQRQKDKDFNTKLELWRLDNSKAMPEVKARIAQLKK